MNAQLFLFWNIFKNLVICGADKEENSTNICLNFTPKVIKRYEYGSSLLDFWIPEFMQAKKVFADAFSLSF